MKKLFAGISTIIGAIAIFVVAHAILAYATASVIGCGLWMGFALNCALFVAFGIARRSWRLARG
jgi:hypothetical protein